MKIIPSGSGLSSLQNLSSFEKHIITENLKKLSRTIDFLIVDTGAGIGDNVLHLNSLSHKTLVVTTPEPHALTDAYALVKVLAKEKGIRDFDLLVNLTCDDKEGEKIAKKLTHAALSFLGVTINYVGCVPNDASLSKSLIRREFQNLLGCHTNSGQAWKKITQKYLSRRSLKNDKSFFESLGVT